MLRSQIKIFLLTLMFSIYLPLSSFAGFVKVNDINTVAEEDADINKKRVVSINFEREAEAIDPITFADRPHSVIYSNIAIDWNDNPNILAQMVLGENNRIELIGIAGIRNQDDIDYTNTFLTAIGNVVNGNFKRIFAASTTHWDNIIQNANIEKQAWMTQVSNLH